MEWSQVVRDIEAQGWSLTQIGDAIGLSVASVSDIKQGRTKEPRGMAAVELHKLHAQLRDAPVEQARAA